MKALLFWLAASALALPLVAYGTPEQRPFSVTLLIDPSGLSGKALTRLRPLPAGILRNLPPGSVAEVYVYNGKLRLLVERTGRIAQGMGLANLKNEPDNPPTTLSAILDHLASQTIYRPALVLITEGRHNDQPDLLIPKPQSGQAPIRTIIITPHRSDRPRVEPVAEHTDSCFLTLDEVTGGVTIAAGILSRLPAPRPFALGREIGAGLASLFLSTLSTERWWELIALLAALSVLTLRRPSVRWWRAARESRTEMLTTALPAGVPQEEPADFESHSFESLQDTPPAASAATHDQTWSLSLLDGELTILSGHGSGQIFRLDNYASTLLGSAPHSDIVIHDPEAALEHCKITPGRGAFEIVAIDTHQGILVNQAKVLRHHLCHDDKITIGKTILRFSLSGP